MAQIKTYARLKPTKKAYNGYVISKNVLTMHIPDNKDFVILGPQNNLRSNFSYDILFTNIFGCEASQEEVFDGVAKDIIQNFLNGYNGTIFAYGQTGTGKTYTVEGNTNRYSARGLATRALSMIYQELEKRSDQHISVYLSYLEIYQEVAYDLLNPAARSTIPIAPFARVTVVEGPRGSCILRGLSLHLAANEEIAQMLLLQGQANRKVAETPVNQRSSRSHAVFTVYLQVRKHDSDVLVNSKLHLVDLAGSERVSKTGVDGQQLTEAKSINLSLHHLETVIIALQLDKPTSAVSKGENPPQQSRSNSSLMSSGPSSDNGGSRQLRFVPYRNSLLTMVLKDSLGGNCLTAMIATISLEPENLGESISTCRFAQRVARIANNARRNEEVDDKAMIKRLKNKVAYLENQVALLGSKGRSDPVTDEEIMEVLTDEDQRICERIMEGFLQGVITDPIEAGISDHCRFRACLHLLKQQFLHRSLVSSSMATGLSTSSALSRVPGSSGAAVTHGTSTSTSTLLPRHSGTQLDVLGANNPQQDSGDYSTIRQAFAQAESVEADPHTRSDELEDLRGRHGYNSYDVRNSMPLSEKSHATKSGRVGGGAEDVPLSHTSDPSGFKNFSSKMKAKRGGIDEILQACSSGGGGGGGGQAADQRYKSPYERRREKEIRRLSRKLTEMEEDTAGKETHLQQMKEQAIVEELLVAETGLRLKLQVAEEQVADQHAYLLQLKHLQADPDLITKEQLVEKQLRKRQAKFHEKLSKVLASKETLEQDFAQRRSGQGASSSLTGPYQDQSCSNDNSVKMSLEERFGQYKQGKGALNTRQVFDLLKNEEKKQQKESQKVKRETNMVKTKQLAIKEAATLEKLRELKQMLKLSLMKEEQQLKQRGEEQNGEDSDARGGIIGEFSSCELNTSSSNRGRENESLGFGRASSNIHGSKIQQAGAHSQSRGSKSSYHEDHPGSRLYDDHLESEKKNVSGSNHTEAWPARSPANQNQSHCSHMTAEQSWKVQQFMAEMIGGSSESNLYPGRDLRSEQGLAIPTFSLSHTSSTLTPDNENLSRSAASTPGVSRLGGLSEKTVTHGSRMSKSFHDPHHSLKFLRNDGDLHSVVGEVENAGRETPTMFATKDPSRSAATRLNINTNNVVGTDDYLESGELFMSDLEPSSTAVCSGNYTGHLTSSSKTGLESNTKLEDKADEDNTEQASFSPLPSLLALQQLQREHNLGPVVLPSEYINSMSSEDQFDARRMGLSSRTFESALNHMLEGDRVGRNNNHLDKSERNAPDLPYTVDPYEGFTRSSRLPQKTGRYNFSLSESPYRQPQGHRQQFEKSSTNGHKILTSDPKKADKNFGHHSVPASAWGPESKNASVADRLANFLESPSTKQDRYYNDGQTGDIQKSPCKETFDSKLAEYQNRSFSNHTSVPSQKDIDDIKSEEEDSFFGLQPAKTKLTALSQEEGEKTFMSTVAAERARVEKIRRARDAAEVIQRGWRKFRARQ